MAYDAPVIHAEQQESAPQLVTGEELPILPPPIPSPTAWASSTSPGSPPSSGRRHRRRIWRGRRLLRSSRAYLYHPEDSDYEVAFPRAEPPPQGGTDGSRGGGPVTTPAWCYSSQPVTGAISATRIAEPTIAADETWADRPVEPIVRPVGWERLAAAAPMTNTTNAASFRTAGPCGEILSAWAIVQRGQATAQDELEVQLVVPLRWTAAGGLVVRPPREKGSRSNGEEQVVPPERVVLMGPPKRRPGGRKVSFTSATPREVPHLPEKLASTQSPRRMSSEGGRFSCSSDVCSESHRGGAPSRRRWAASVGCPIPLSREQYSEPLVASSATHAWIAASRDTGRATRDAINGPPTPPPARGTPLRKASRQSHEQRTDEEDPTVEWQTTGLFPTLSNPAADVPLVRVDTEAVPRPRTLEGDDDGPNRWPLSRPPADSPHRCVVSFSSPLPVAGMPSEMAFSFLGVLVPSVSTVGGVTSLRLEWATLRFAAAVIEGGSIGDLGGGSRGSPTAAVVDMVDFGVRLHGAAAAEAGWVVAEVEPRPDCVPALITTGAPDVSVAAGPSGVSVSRGGGSFVESVRAPYVVAATVCPHGIVAHTADWRWELKSHDDGSPYYAHRGGRRVRTGGCRQFVANAAAPAAATQSHASPAGALHASWTAPAASVAAAPSVAFEVYARPRVVRWRRGGLGASVRLALSRSEPRLSSGIEYSRVFVLPIPVGEGRDAGTPVASR